MNTDAELYHKCICYITHRSVASLYMISCYCQLSVVMISLGGFIIEIITRIGYLKCQWTDITSTMSIMLCCWGQIT